MLLTLFFWLLMGFSTAYFAYQRGRNPYAWFIIGILFGLLGMLFLFLMPVINTNVPDLEEKEVIIGNNDSKEPAIDLQVLDKNHDFFIKDWFYLDDQHKQCGPISFELMRKLIEEKNIQMSSYVWCEGMSDWKRIEEFDTLKAFLVN